MQITRKEGRIGQPDEYVEYRVKDMAFIAQRGSSYNWFIFQSEAGPKGAVVTLDWFYPNQREEAVKAANCAALAYQSAVDR